jgi:hypothetical protein
MIVITADQRNSRSTPSASAATIRDLTAGWEKDILRPVELSAGDEIQIITASAPTAMDIILLLTDPHAPSWSVGVGTGAVTLAATARESIGPAFIAARRAVDRAKKRGTHFALESEPEAPLAAHLESLVDLLLLLRQRRTEPGWQLYTLLSKGYSQLDAARALNITPQSVSERAITAGLRAEETATVALASLLATLDAGGEET